MKIAYIIHNVADTSSIDEIIKKAGLENYSRIEKVTGKTIGNSPLLDTPVWPGYYTLTIAEAGEEKMEVLRLEIKKLKLEMKSPELKYYELDIKNFF